MLSVTVCVPSCKIMSQRYSPDSKPPVIPEKPGVLSYTSTIILLVFEGSPGAGPPPVFLCAFFFLAELLLGRAEESFPFLFYFVDGSAGYTNGINLLCNGFPCFSFGFIRHIVGKLALQDAFICLHVFCNYCQLSGSKIWFPLSFFCTVSGMLFRVHVYTTYTNP